MNSRYYVGKHQTKNLHDGYMGSGKLIRQAIEKYGKENFVKEILHVFNNEADMNAAEAELVILSEDSYNLCQGGKGGWGYVIENRINQKKTKSRLDHSRRALSKARERFHERLRTDDEFKRQWIERLRGRRKTIGTTGFRFSNESRAKMSASASGERSSQFGSFWITNGVDSAKSRGYIPEGWRRGRIIKGR